MSEPTASRASSLRRRTCAGSATLRANRITPQGRAARSTAASRALSSRPARPVMNAESIRQDIRLREYEPGLGPAESPPRRNANDGSGVRPAALAAPVLRHPAVLAGGLELVAESHGRPARSRRADESTIPDALLSQ